MRKSPKRILEIFYFTRSESQIYPNSICMKDYLNYNFINLH